MANQVAKWNIKKRWAEWSHLLPETLGWYSKATLTSLYIKKRNTDWLMVLKANKKNKTYVLFISAPSFFGLYVQLGARIQRDHMQWKPDRQPPDMGA